MNKTSVFHMKNGFSLLEMAIVIVVIGLIAGGVTIGANMMEAAKRKSLMERVQQVRDGVQSFRTMYNAYPGDLLTATSYFPTASACPAGGATGTCNGNGDNAINTTASGSDNHETRIFAQHLSYAKILPGTYDSGWTAGVPAVIGTQIIDTPYSGVGIIAMNTGNYGTTGDFYDGLYGNYLRVGIPTSGHVTDRWMSCDMLSGLDKKFDDNKPGTGWIRASVNQCTTNTSPTATKTAEYDPIQTAVTQAIWLLENPIEIQNN